MFGRMVRPEARDAGRRGFTLIELLVCVAIIALLMAILLPTLGRAREQGKAVQCASNLHQMGNASAAYTVENDGLLFPDYWAGWTVTGVGTGPSLDIRDVLAEYFRMADWNKSSANRFNIWTCPSIKIDIKSTSSQQWPLTYGANCMPHPRLKGDPTYVPSASDWWQNRQVKLARMPRTAQVISIADTAQLSTGTSQGFINGTSVQPKPWWNGTNESENPAYEGYPGTSFQGANVDYSSSRVRYRHRGDTDANLLFLDGHAESFRGPILGKNLSTGY